MLDDFNARLIAIRDAMPAKSRIPREQWQATAERLIRETILECFGEERAFLLRLLLLRCPFFPDEPEFKTIWYQEHRRQLNPPDVSGMALATGETETSVGWTSGPSRDSQPDEDGPEVHPTIEAKSGPRKPVRMLIPQDQWASASRFIIEMAIKDFPRWNEPSKGEANYRTIEFLQELRFRYPMYSPDDEIPAEYDRPAECWASDCRGFLDAWYQQCGELMGFRIHKPTVAPVAAKPKSGPKQLTLF